MSDVARSRATGATGAEKTAAEIADRVLTGPRR